MSATLTLSDRVGVLLATYVGVEAEQERIAATDPTGRDRAVSARVAALGETAFAVVREVEAIEDRSGNADLAATLILLETMRLHNYAQLGSFEWGEDDRLNLQVLAALAGSTTGEVRRHTAAVLATIGITVSDEGADPLAELVREYLDGMAAYNAATGNTDEQDRELQKSTWEPSYDRLGTNPPAPTSLAGVAAAMRVVLFEDDSSGCAGVFVGPVLRAALAFLEGKTAR